MTNTTDALRDVMAAIVLLAVSGCAVTADQVDAAQRFCTPHGGLSYIPAHFGSRYEKVAVVCNDGSKADVRVRLVAAGEG